MPHILPEAPVNVSWRLINGSLEQNLALALVVAYSLWLLRWYDMWAQIVASCKTLSCRWCLDGASDATASGLSGAR